MEKTSECSLNEIEPELRELIEARIQPGEDVLACFRVEYHMLWAEIITTKQVIVAKAIALRTGLARTKLRLDMPHVTAIPLGEIVKIEPGHSNEYELFTVNLTGRDGQALEINFTLESAAQSFYKILTQVLGLGGKKPSSSNAERLRELTNLREEGLITEEEYQAKRADILKNL
jgi:hypothetical protein